jgi:hypothetical protein
LVFWWHSKNIIYAVCDGATGCANGGVCVATDLCHCPSGFSGNLCQDTDPGKHDKLTARNI